MHPRSRHWHMIVFIITRCQDKMDIHSIRAMRGANCWTDHQMLRSKVAFRIRHKHNRQGTSKPTKLNTAKLGTTSHRESRRWSMLSPNGRRRKAQHRTRIGQLRNRSYTIQTKTYLGKPDRKHFSTLNSLLVTEREGALVSGSRIPSRKI